MLELYYWAWRLLILGVVIAVIYGVARELNGVARELNWLSGRAMKRRSKQDAIARGLLNTCRDHWEAGGQVVFRARDGKERTLKRC